MWSHPHQVAIPVQDDKLDCFGILRENISLDQNGLAFYPWPVLQPWGYSLSHGWCASSYSTDESVCLSILKTSCLKHSANQKQQQLWLKASRPLLQSYKKTMSVVTALFFGTKKVTDPKTRNDQGSLESFKAKAKQKLPASSLVAQKKAGTIKKHLSK